MNGVSVRESVCVFPPLGRPALKAQMGSFEGNVRT